MNETQQQRIQIMSTNSHSPHNGQRDQKMHYMEMSSLLSEVMPQRTNIVCARVLTLTKDENVLVSCDIQDEDRILCDVLNTSEGAPLHLVAGDMVLVWLPESDEERGVVLGRIGPSHAPAAEPEKEQETPDELVIEAKKNLTLKCGDGSITLRKDGKILIKGKDLVSQAKRTNRIKGGSVAIN